MNAWRKPQRAGLRASESAWKLEQLCYWGISLRIQGQCAGELGAVQRSDPHLRNGHDAGCLTLGIPLPLAVAQLAQWDGVGAQRFLLEAFSDSVAELTATAQHGVWQPSSARDSIAHAIRRRITPLAPHRRDTAAASTIHINTEIQRGPRLKLQPRPPPSHRTL